MQAVLAAIQTSCQLSQVILARAKSNMHTSSAMPSQRHSQALTVDMEVVGVDSHY